MSSRSLEVLVVLFFVLLPDLVREYALLQEFSDIMISGIKLNDIQDKIEDYDFIIGRKT